MSNWDAQLDAARNGTLATMIPANLSLPMVAPADLGNVAAARLLGTTLDHEIRYVEGPRRYTPRDVAKAFGDALGHDVELTLIPREDWLDTYRSLGFSEAAAESFARMTAVSIAAGFEGPDSFERGDTTIEQYVGALVEGADR